MTSSSTASAEPLSLPDTFQSFLFDGLPVRGLLVQLRSSWRELLARQTGTHQLPYAVQSLMGEATAAAVLMRSQLKFEGTLELQIQGDAALKLLVAEVRDALDFRATCKWVGPQQSQHPLAHDGSPDLAALVNTRNLGRCAVTLTMSANPSQPYQGIVALSDAEGLAHHSLAQSLAHYMMQSEQLETHFVLAANQDAAAGLLLQRVPIQGENNLQGQGGVPSGEETDIDAFERLKHVLQTLTAQELLTLPDQDVLHRLFWQDTLLDMGRGSPRFSCTCSRDRVGAMLTQLGQADVNDLLQEQGGLAEVVCEFCGQAYRFDAQAVAELFSRSHEV